MAESIPEFEQLDDDAAIRILHVAADFTDRTAELLEQADERFTVVTETSAADGLDRIDEGDVDCVLADYDLLDTDGVEFLQSVREAHPGLPFILYTGKGSEAIASEAVSAGVTDYFLRESGAEQYEMLANRIRNAVGRHRTERAFEEFYRVTQTLRQVNQELVRADGREELERRVCEELTATGSYDAAWIGHYDPETERITPRVWAELPEDYFEDIVITADPERETGKGPAGAAVRSHELQVINDVPEQSAMAPWREELQSYGVRILAAVPIVYEGTVYGVMGVYATRPTEFDEREREMLTELGTTVGHAVNAIETRRELRRQNRKLDEFASLVSHDLRNPLNIARGHLQPVREQVGGESAALAQIEEALERMCQIIEDMLTLARDEQAITVEEGVDVAALAEEAWTNVDTREATLSVDGAPTLAADRRRLLRVFENFFRNAVEHGSTSRRQDADDAVEPDARRASDRAAPGDAVEHGGESVTVRVGPLDGADGGGFYVEDDGVGIPADEREQVFEFGYTTAEDGSGFGLKIVTEIVDAHGWELDVTEGTDGGARFEITGVESG